MSKNTIMYMALAALVVAGLVWGGRSARESVAYWNDTKVACLPNGHQSLELHIHPRIAVSVDGVPEIIPGGIGNTHTCMAEMHTHDASGEIHVESVSAGRAGSFTLADFFAVWGRSFEREGYGAALSVNGARVEGPEAVPLRDGDSIVVEYRSIVAEGPQAAP